MKQLKDPYYDPRGAHIRLYHEVYDSHAFACLAGSSKLIYLAMHRRKTSYNNGDLSMPLSAAQQYGIKSSSTLAKALRELVSVGLVAVTREGGCQRDGKRLATLYRLTDFKSLDFPMKHVEGMKATDEWKKFKTRAAARQALKLGTAEAALVEDKRQMERALRGSVTTTSKNGGKESQTASKIGDLHRGRLHYLKLV